jgi:hypothetical protein
LDIQKEKIKRLEEIESLLNKFQQDFIILDPVYFSVNAGMHNIQNALEAMKGKKRS